ncbi:hypothetical protein MP228_012079 [Amoeboaphelidium protococcarum]|nr:hypothetical protein MP228_012079 [Amoeboaphelidium protococcarum]
MAQVDSRKIAETVRVLNEHAVNLLSGLYNYVYIFNGDGPGCVIDTMVPEEVSALNRKSEQPRLFTEQPYQAFVKQVLKKFPDVPDTQKNSFAQALQTDARQVLAEIQPIYQLFVDIMEFTEVSISCLLVCDRLVGLNCQQHFRLTDGILKLLCNLVSVHLLMGKLADEKKIVASVFNFLTQYLSPSKMGDMNYGRMASFFAVYDKPIVALQEQLSPMTLCLSTLLQSSITEYMKYGPMSMEQIRKDGVYASGINVKSLTVDEAKIRVIPSFNDFSYTVVIGMLVIPAEYLKTQALSDALKFVLSQNIVFVVFRSEVLNIATEIDVIVKSNSKLSKIKQLISEAHAEGLYKAVQLHSSRREYVKFALKQWVLIVQDSPFVIGYKLPVLLSLMNLAKEELVWYFNHHDKTVGYNLPKFAPKAPNVQQGNDPKIFELMHALTKLKKVLLSQQMVAQEFYSNLMNTHYGPLIDNLVQKLKDTCKLEPTIEMILYSIANKVRDSNILLTFGDLRLDYERLLVHIYSVESSIDPRLVPDFIALMNEIVYRTRFIDETQSIIDENCNLKFSYHFRSLIQEQVNEVLSSYPDIVLCLNSVFIASSDFILNANGYVQKEVDHVSAKSNEWINIQLQNISRSAADYCQAVINYHVSFGNQTLDENGVIFVPDKRDKKTSKKAAQQQIVKPGYESVFRNAAYIGSIPVLRLALINCVDALTALDYFAVFDHLYSPSEYLKDAITMKLRAILMAAPYIQAAPTSPHKDGADEPPFQIKRPSQFLNELNAITDVIQRYCGPQAHGIIRDVLLEQLDLNMARKYFTDVDMNAIKSLPKKPSKKPVAFTGNSDVQSFMVTYVNWYVEYVRDRATYNVAVVSELKKQIVSHSQSTFKAQYYTDLTELIALCQIIGPSGVRIMDERFLHLIFHTLKDVKEYVNANSELLFQLQKNWFIEGRFDDLAKKFKGVDDVLQKSINVGLVLLFRKNLYEALGIAFSNKASAVTSLVGNVYNKYDVNVFNNVEYAALDNLANFIGINDRGDNMVKVAFNMLCKNQMTDQKLFSLLPYLFAVAFKSLVPDLQSNFIVQLEALDNNGHCLAYTVDVMLTYLIALTSPNAESGFIAQVHKEFVQVSSAMLMKNKDSLRADVIRGLYLVVRKFCQLSKYISTDVLEEVFPYAIARAAFGDLGRKQGAQQKVKTSKNAPANTKTEEEVAL